MFRRILIANRGEIAVRIIRTCRAIGIETVAVYSDADATALHVGLADAAVRLGAAPPAESYLSIERILAAATQTGADAIHPGYGVLSENPAFASACAAAGIVFIGPPADAIERMGSKIAARGVAAAAGIPVVPGEIPDGQDDAAIAAAARRVGYPLILKPSAGGGGIGMKTVRDADRLADAIAQARREATAAFGDGTLYLERLVEHPRHVEIQVLADRHGGVVHLFERDCSIQRRHQKVVEESPSPALTPALRQRMGEAAVAVTRQAGYRNAGTVEFLLEGTGDDAAFYFLEMNTRLQVEHPVTEQITGVDLVAAQIGVAAGERIPWTQTELSQRGHAFELRIYAEDPAHGHLPQAGPLLLYREPAGPGVRVDAGVVEGDEISVHYDPMIAKLITSGDTRDAARLRAIAALRSFPILGVRTNIGLLLAILEHPRMIAGNVNTHFLDTEGDALRASLTAEPDENVLAVATHLRTQAVAPASATAPTLHALSDPWATLVNFRA